MATRSTITKKTSDGIRKTIYCHWDGYPSFNGKILLENYDTEEKVDELINLGNLSILGKRIKPDEGEPHTFDEPAKDVCVAYGRDRGEEGQEAVEYQKHETIQSEEFNYIFIDNKWYCSEDGRSERHELTPEYVSESY